MNERSPPGPGDVRVRNAWKSFDKGRIAVLKGVDLDVRRGEMLALWGVSGSGKSTLLHLVGGLDIPDRGEVTVSGIDTATEPARLAIRRFQVGFVFQLHNLIPDLTASENILAPSIASGLPRTVARERLAALLEASGLSHRRDHRIQDMSGGERQRTAICRALINKPAVLLADEPTGALDERTGEIIFGLFREMAKREGVTVILATHERKFAEGCDRILRMREGSLHDL
jgi:lipoprotein-releasing system ATP-binding protein